MQLGNATRDPSVLTVIVDQSPSWSNSGVLTGADNVRQSLRLNRERRSVEAEWYAICLFSLLAGLGVHLADEIG